MNASRRSDSNLPAGVCEALGSRNITVSSVEIPRLDARFIIAGGQLKEQTLGAWFFTVRPLTGFQDRDDLMLADLLFRMQASWPHTRLEISNFNGGFNGLRRHRSLKRWNPKRPLCRFRN